MASGRRRLAAIMFTDMVGYSALVQDNETAALRVLDRHNKMLRPIFGEFGGREVKTAGDSFLVEFDSALEAAQCAVEIQRRLREYNASAPAGAQFRIRVGVHVGDVVREEGDVLGDAVNIAARIQPLAEPGGICLTQAVVDQVQNKLGCPVVRLPPTSLKNIRLPVTVYRVVPPWEPAASAALTAPAVRVGEGRQLAVLPLANISPDPNDAYFADGLTEELITVLSQVRGLSVIARTSVLPYKAAPKSVAQIGAELGVDTILEGSVRKAGNHLRIALQLIDVTTQRHLWANSYNREVGDVFAIQTDLAERTAESLKLEFEREEGIGPREPATLNPAAYEAYLRGRVAAAANHNSAGLAEAVREFGTATRLDPGFADAYASWAHLYVAHAGDTVPMREVMPRAKELAAKAIALDPNSSDAHLALANIAFQFDHDWTRAEEEFRRAVALNPSNAQAWSVYGMFLLSLRRPQAGLEAIQRAARLDPSGVSRVMLPWAEFDSGNVDAAIRAAELARDTDPTSASGHVYAGMMYLRAGRRADAVREADASLDGASEVEKFDMALLNAMVGRPAPARALLAAIERGEAKLYVSATDRAMLHSALGDRERALELLEQDAREGDQILWLYYRGNFFDPIRDDPRFAALLEGYGLPGPVVGRSG